ncbi:Porin [Candidatus Electrothrix laxa]
MKKVLVAGAALMLAGSMVSAASAGNPVETPDETTGVSISGDARVTYVGWTDYDRDVEDSEANGYSDYFESRVGLNFDAVAKGGASVHARLYFDDKGYNDDVVWDGSGDAQWGVSTDYAYFKVPLSETMTMEAGRMPLNFTKFYSWDIRPTRVRLVYKSGNLKLIPFVGVVDEDSTNLDNWDDNDFMQYGIVPVLKINDAWTVKGFFRYNDDAREWATDSSVVVVSGAPVEVAATENDDRSGFDGSVNLSGTVGNVGLTAEVSYVSADYQKTEDDGIGGYVQAAFSMPGITPVVLAGMTQDGFVADRNFGFVMVGGNEPTTVVDVGNSDGDLMFGALVLMHDISDRFSAQCNLLYASYDYDDEEGKIDSAIEVSGVLSYVLSESTSFEYKLGYLAPTYNDGADEVLEDAYIGHSMQMNVEF